VSREVDLRDQSVFTTFVLGSGDLPSGAEGFSGSLVEKALAVAKFTVKVAGAENTGSIEFDVEESPPTSRLGTTSVHLQQQLRGIPVAFGSQIVRFRKDGEVQRTQGRLVVSAQSRANLTITPEAAALTALRHLASTANDDANNLRPSGPYDPQNQALIDFAPRTLMRFVNLPSQPTVLEQGPLAEPIAANLTWVAIAKLMKLCWDLTIVVSEFEGAFRFLVSAEDGAIVYCKQTVPGATQGNVFVVNPRAPRRLVSFPRPWSDYAALSVDGVPEAPPSWVETTSTSGYAASAAIGANGLPISGVVTDGLTTFNPSDDAGREQMAINAFYGVCAMHDFFYLLGFREADGSYQQGGVSSNGQACTRIKAEVRTDPVLGTAHWWPYSNALRFGPKDTTGRPTALDMTIVAHEYTHAVTSRMVGHGTIRNPFQEPQSEGMAEGWGDYVAISVTGETVMGGWLTNDERGMRKFPYDANFPVASRNFGIIGSLVKYEIGELWCAALLQMNREVGVKLGLQLVVESLRDLPTNPSLLDGRDMLLAAVDDRQDNGLLSADEHGKARMGVWRAFAKFGMGPTAASNGPSLSGVTADFNVPGPGM